LSYQLDLSALKAPIMPRLLDEIRETCMKHVSFCKILLSLSLLLSLPNAYGTPSELRLLGDSEKWRLATGLLSEGSEGVRSLRKRIAVTYEQDFYTLSWKDWGEGQFYLSPKQAINLSELNSADSTLVMKLRINGAPKRQVILRKGCGDPCAGEAGITRLAKAIPSDEWLRVSIGLACFTTRGLGVTKVNTPFVLLTSGKFVASIRDVCMASAVNDTATVKCS
jgi:hypothetical protein